MLTVKDSWVLDEVSRLIEEIKKTSSFWWGCSGQGSNRQRSSTTFGKSHS
ncbi:MAG TPA: hypothetical protein PLN14_07725 [Candidatus Hydrothermia bacterium]|nr:hypothetical protein [Candidatus Hydrothermia bacterium]